LGECRPCQAQYSKNAQATAQQDAGDGLHGVLSKKEKGRCSARSICLFNRSEN
jgi:hypothetical protein